MGEKYIISDVGKQLDVESHVLRYWEKELDIKVTRNKLGHRVYGEEEIALLKRVKLLKEKGLQLKAIKLILTSANFDLDENVNTKLNANDNQDSVEYKVTSKENKLSESKDKLVKFQQLIKIIFENSLKENNEMLKNEVRDEIKKINKESEAIQEKRFRKLDETLREVQATRKEIAVYNAEKKKKRKFFSKK